MLVLLSKTAVGTSQSGAAINIERPIYALFELDVTLADTDVGDTLDVYVQHSPDSGTTWYDFVHFPQFTGTDGAGKRHIVWSGTLIPVVVTEPNPSLTPGAETLVANTVLHGVKFSTWRGRAVIVDAGAANASFSFKLSARIVQDR